MPRHDRSNTNTVSFCKDKYIMQSYIEATFHISVLDSCLQLSSVEVIDMKMTFKKFNSNLSFRNRVPVSLNNPQPSLWTVIIGTKWRPVFRLLCLWGAHVHICMQIIIFLCCRVCFKSKYRVPGSISAFILVSFSARISSVCALVRVPVHVCYTSVS